MPAPIWVHLTYQSAFVDDAGKLQIRRDVYNLDSRTLAAIKSERGMVEPPQERKRDEIASTSGRRAGRRSRSSRAPSRSSRRCSAAGRRTRRRGPCPRAASRDDRPMFARRPPAGGASFGHGRAPRNSLRQG